MTQHARNDARDSSDSKTKSNIVQNKDSNVKGKPETSLAGKDHVAKEHVKRSWLPWKRHSDKLAQKEKNEDKKPKCKPGKPCKDENKVAQVDEDKLKCIHGPCKVCPPGSSLNKKGVCVSTPQNAPYNTAQNCPTDSLNAGQVRGQPCNTNPAQNNCSVLASDIQREEMELERIRIARQTACYQDPGSQECLDLTSQYEKEALRLEQLRTEYNACLHR